METSDAWKGLLILYKSIVLLKGVYAKMSLTEKEQRALDAIRELSKSGFPPTIMEVANAIGSRSSRTTQVLIRSLRDKGYLKRWPNGKQCRSLLLAPQMKSAA